MAAKKKQRVVRDSGEDRCWRCHQRKPMTVRLNGEVACTDCLDSGDMELDDWSIPEDY